MKIKNWKQYQHFNHRKPIWIKFYCKILDDCDIQSLSRDAYWFLTSLWLLACEDEKLEGNLPDIRTIAFRLRLSMEQVKTLLNEVSHFIEDDNETIDNPEVIQPAIKMLSKCYQSVNKPDNKTINNLITTRLTKCSPETEKEIEIETEYIDNNICNINSVYKEGVIGGEKKQVKQKFIPPTLEEVKNYCKEKNYDIDPEYFLDRNTATGWVDKNGNKYKDWKAVLRTWAHYHQQKVNKFVQYAREGSTQPKPEPKQEPPKPPTPEDIEFQKRQIREALFETFRNIFHIYCSKYPDYSPSFEEYLKKEFKGQYKEYEPAWIDAAKILIDKYNAKNWKLIPPHYLLEEADEIAKQKTGT
jgi:hypothetical protein